MLEVALLSRPLEPALECLVLQDADGDCGGIVSFTGVVRSGESGTIEALVLEAYRTVTIRSLEAIGRDALDLLGARRAVIKHRVGRIAAGEPIVFVAAAARHRRAAFDTVDYIMDRLKTEAVFWKKEVAADGEAWIEPRQSDYADVLRWSSR
ncbi:molybdenum cofactor biosynthesis protein MoaE [Novosphingobium sp.]|uniref:molybdenum cofactor biosynthesis protein MoaE n=1 Tax=Novosphingobium sp. TaxID=1874826 RepID=UPI0038BB2FA0